MALQRGNRIGPYEIRQCLRKHSTVEIYRAVDTQLRRDVTIKVGRPPWTWSPEAHKAARLFYPGIETIYEVVTDEPPPAPTVYLVAEALQGQTLRERMQEAVKIDWREAIRIAIDVVDSLAHAHHQGVVHRNLRPETIFLTAEGNVKILDFLLPPSNGATLSILEELAYRSPEEFEGGTPAPADDIYSLGCVLYEMLAGRNPFLKESAAATKEAILKFNPPALTLPAEASGLGVNLIVRRCLEKKPAARFESAVELADQLRSALTPAGRGIMRSIPRYLLPTWRKIAAALVLFFPLTLSWMFLTALSRHAPDGLQRAVGLLSLPNWLVYRYVGDFSLLGLPESWNLSLSVVLQIFYCYVIVCFIQWSASLARRYSSRLLGKMPDGGFREERGTQPASHA